MNNNNLSLIVDSIALLMNKYVPGINIKNYNCIRDLFNVFIGDLVNLKLEQNISV